MILGDQPTLPEHHRAIVWQWFLENFEGYLSGRTEQLLQQDQSTSDEALSHSTGSDHGLTADMQLMQKALSPSVFDSDGETEFRVSKIHCIHLNRKAKMSAVRSLSYEFTVCLKRIRVLTVFRRGESV